MSEESTTPDLVALVRRVFEAFDRRDVDALLSFYAPDAAWDFSQREVGVAARAGHVHTREGGVFSFSVDGMIVRLSTYDDIDEARAAAEPLEQEQEWTVSENLDLVCSIHVAS